MIIDKLVNKIKETQNPTVIGLDPTLDLIPPALKKDCFNHFGKWPNAVGELFTTYNKAIIDAVADIVPAVKPQIAMYEAFGIHGIAAYTETCRYAAEKGLIVIGDIKRGDISSTAEAYAAHIAGTEIEGEHYDLWHEDAVTVNPYLGTDGITPFTDACKKTGKMIFVLVKTSNPSSSELQDLPVIASEAKQSSALYLQTAKLAEKWGEDLIGESGYSSVGAVVGATNPQEGAKLRALFPKMFFLVPGYGAQGATAKDLKGFADKSGGGIIVNSSRGIIAAWKKDPQAPPAEAEGAEALTHAAKAARAAAIAMKEDLKSLS